MDPKKYTQISTGQYEVPEFMYEQQCMTKTTSTTKGKRNEKNK